MWHCVRTQSCTEVFVSSGDEREGVESHIPGFWTSLWLVSCVLFLRNQKVARLSQRVSSIISRKSLVGRALCYSLSFLKFPPKSNLSTTPTAASSEMKPMPRLLTLLKTTPSWFSSQGDIKDLFLKQLMEVISLGAWLFFSFKKKKNRRAELGPVKRLSKWRCFLPSLTTCVQPWEPNHRWRKLAAASLSSDPCQHTMTQVHPGHRFIDVIKHLLKLSYIKAESIQKAKIHASVWTSQGMLLAFPFFKLLRR